MSNVGGGTHSIRESSENTCIQTDTNKTFGHFHSSAEWKSYFTTLCVHTAVSGVRKAFFKKSTQSIKKGAEEVLLLKAYVLIY